MVARNNFLTIRSEVAAVSIIAVFLTSGCDAAVPFRPSGSPCSPTRRSLIRLGKTVGTALLARFPNATPEELSAAQAYAYGGAIIQDLGYYPYGSHFFSDLTHYVRSGDFIMRSATTPTTFMNTVSRWGAMAHYAADNNVIVSGRTAQCRCSIRIEEKVRRQRDV